MDILHT